MRDWLNIEAHFMKSETDDTYHNLCDTATPDEFYFCVLPSEFTESEGVCVIDVVPKTLWDNRRHLTYCPLMIREILPPRVKLSDDDEYISFQSIEDTKALMVRLGYTESKEVQSFLLNAYGINEEDYKGSRRDNKKE